MRSPSLSHVSAPYVLLKAAAGRVKEEEREKKEEEDPSDMGTRGYASAHSIVMCGEMYRWCGERLS